MEYRDVIYDKAYDESVKSKLESYIAAFARAGSIKSSSTEKLYQELQLESLSVRRWYRKLSFFFKNCNNETPPYLSDLLPKNKQHTRNSNDLPIFRVPLLKMLEKYVLSICNTCIRMEQLRFSYSKF